MPVPLSLAEVTVCAVDTRHPELALFALQRSMAQARFARAILFTSSTWRPQAWPSDVEVVAVDHVTSSAAYSEFMLKGLYQYIHTSHVLVIQWDGFISNPGRWHADFLKYDYVGAVWPQFDDGDRVGNGGFSLRSVKLLEALQSPNFDVYHPEDVAICRLYKKRLHDEYDVVVAPEHLANQFAVERQGDAAHAFGFHGFSNMMDVLSESEFQALLDRLPPDVFLSTEARRAVRKLLDRGWPHLAHRVLAERVRHSRWSVSNLRLWTRIVLNRF